MIKDESLLTINLKANNAVNLNYSNAYKLDIINQTAGE